MTNRQSRAFWVIPCQPVQQLFGAQGSDRDPEAGTVLMALISAMAMNDGFNGVPAFHVSISQRELAKRTAPLSRKAVCNALTRLEKRGHLTPIRGPSDGTRRGPNARITYRIDLLADKATAFHIRGPSTGPSTGPDGGKKGPLYIQTEFPDGEQIPPMPPTPAVGGRSNGNRTQGGLPGGDGGEFQLAPYLDIWREAFDAYPTHPGLLGKLLKPVEPLKGPEVTRRRWRHFVAGIKARPGFLGTEAKQFKNFAATPAAYDDPHWYLSDRERAELARVTEGLFT